MATIPGAIALKCLENILWERRQEAARRADRSGGSKQVGRQRMRADLDAQLATIRDLLGQRKERWAADVDAATLGWRCAWAAGHTEARVQLYAHLAAIYHPRAGATLDIGGAQTEIGAVARRLLSEE